MDKRQQTGLNGWRGLKSRSLLENIGLGGSDLGEATPGTELGI
jgi:hypothetical protein